MKKRKDEKLQFLHIKIQTLVQVAFYVAIMILMNFTPNFGYIKVGFLTITLMFIPVIVMSLHLGWKGALFIWTFFGLLQLAATPIYEPIVPEFFGWKATVLGYLLGRILTGVIVAIFLKEFDLVGKWKNWENKKLFCIIKTVFFASFCPFLSWLITLSFFYYFSITPRTESSFWIYFAAFGAGFAFEFPIVAVVVIHANVLISYLRSVNRNNKLNSF